MRKVSVVTKGIPKELCREIEAEVRKTNDVLHLEKKFPSIRMEKFASAYLAEQQREVIKILFVPR